MSAEGSRGSPSVGTPTVRVDEDAPQAVVIVTNFGDRAGYRNRSALRIDAAVSVHRSGRISAYGSGLSRAGRSDGITVTSGRWPFVSGRGQPTAGLSGAALSACVWACPPARSAWRTAPGSGAAFTALLTSEPMTEQWQAPSAGRSVAEGCARHREPRRHLSRPAQHHVMCALSSAD